jgi:hypothetical protein
MPARGRRLAPPAAVVLRFEVQQRDVAGPVRRALFATEREALNFADMLVHWMARRGEKGTVKIIWPAGRARPASE